MLQNKNIYICYTGNMLYLYSSCTFTVGKFRCETMHLYLFILVFSFHLSLIVFV